MKILIERKTSEGLPEKEGIYRVNYYSEPKMRVEDFIKEESIIDFWKSTVESWYEEVEINVQSIITNLLKENK
jgi:hypothetical protein